MSLEVSTAGIRPEAHSPLPNSSSLIPTHYQASLQVMQAVAKVCQMCSRSLPMFTNAVVAGAKQLTGATWVELLLVQENELVVCPSGEDLKYSTKQPQTRIPVSDQSLPGQVFLLNACKSFSSPQTSSSYRNMQFKLTPFSSETHEPLDTFSVAAIPITDPEEECVGVLVIFNKIDENLSRTFFTSNDLALSQELCNVIGSLTQSRDMYGAVKKDLDMYRLLLEEKDNLESSFTRLLGKKKKLQRILKAINNGEFSMSVNLVSVLAKTLEVDAVVVHEARQGEISPMIVYGLQTDKCDSRAASYCAFTTRETLNIKDISTEPLLSGVQIPMKTMLCCPIFDHDECVSVIEFYRKSGGFHELDLTLFRQVVASVAKIPLSRYKKFVHLESDMRFSVDLNADWLTSFISEFSLPRKNETFDYVRLLNQVESGINRLFQSSLCSVYILDERKNLVWTRKSDSCDPLIFTRDTNSFLGSLSHANQPVSLPLTGDWLQKTGAKAYANATGLCCPIKSEFLDNEGTVGILIIEKNTEFTKTEIRAVELYLRTLANSFVHLFFDKKYISPDIGLAQPPSPSSFLELNIEETVLERTTTSGKAYHFSSESTQEGSQSFELFSKMSTISPKRFEAVVKLCSSLRGSELSPYRLLAQGLAHLIPSEATRLLIFDTHRKHLVDKETGVVYTPSGLVKTSLQTRSVVSIVGEVTERLDFDPSIDALGLHKLNNVLIVPIIFFAKEAVGVLIFANLQTPPVSEDILVAQLLAFLSRELLIESDDTFLNWRNVIQTGRKQKMLFKWCGEIFRVLVYSQERTFKCSSLLNRLRRSPSLEDLLSITLETMALALNCEGARLILKDSSTSMLYFFTMDTGLSCLNEVLDPIVETAISEKMAVSSGKVGEWENSLTHPVFLEREVVGALQVWNKKDEAMGSFSGFSMTDETALRDVCTKLGSPCRAFLSDKSDFAFPDLTTMLKEQVWAINNSSFFLSIRQACKTLLDCDQALIFLREGEKLVVRPQGTDAQDKVGWVLELGHGIVGRVAKTGKAANVRDAYEDPDFDTFGDVKTGYRTRSLLCVPVVARGKSIAALEVSNKMSGFFDSTDLEILEMFSDVVAGALQSMKLFQNLVDEKNQYTEVLNSIGCAIIVLNAEGKLHYANRPLNHLLPVSDGFAKTHVYTRWLQGCPGLQSDIDSVREGRMNKVKRKFQQLTNERNMQDRRYDYRIISFDEDLERRKTILVLEEVLGRQARPLVDDKSQSSQMSIKSENTLQTCISKLADLVSVADNEFQEDLESVISTLKSGNLDHTKVIVTEREKMDLVNYIDPEMLELSSGPRPDGLRHHRRKSEFSPDSGLSIPVELAQLRDWNLNFLDIDNEAPYILSMLNDFHMVKHFGIKVSTLQNFLGDVKALYSHRGNPFHNYKHAVTVMHNVYCLFSSTAAGRLYEDFELFGLLIAALGHDVDHTGRTNAFESSKETTLALRYHDMSVLEQHHAATLFLLMKKDEDNIFSYVDSAEKKQMRKLMIAAIIATDMSKHFTMVANMAARFKELVEDPLGSRQNDKKETAELLLHSSDLSNPTKMFELSYRWSSALSNEFLSQVQEEKELGLPVTAFMQDLHRPAIFIKNEVNFYSAIVKPLWECLSLWLDPGISLALSNLNANIERLKEMLKKEEEDGS